MAGESHARQQAALRAGVATAEPTSQRGRLTALLWTVDADTAQCRNAMQTRFRHFDKQQQNNKQQKKSPQRLFFNYVKVPPKNHAKILLQGLASTSPGKAGFDFVSLLLFLLLCEQKSPTEEMGRGRSAPCAHLLHASVPLFCFSTSFTISRFMHVPFCLNRTARLIWPMFLPSIKI